MITSIIFSKNRPLQLDLCLKSIKQNLNLSNEIVIIYKADADYQNAYDILIKEYPKVIFIKQSNHLIDDILLTLKYASNKFISFFTDDCICYRKCDLKPEDLIDIMNYELIACFSLRLGLNINIRMSEAGEAFSDKPILIYNYKDYIIIPKSAHTYGSYWSYSLSVDGHIFRKTDMINMVDELSYLYKRYPVGSSGPNDYKQTPNDFESDLQRFWTVTPNMIAAEKTSSVVNSPNNRVQNSYKNRRGDQYYLDENYLNKLYLDGFRIDLNNINFNKINSPHTEIKLI